MSLVQRWRLGFYWLWLARPTRLTGVSQLAKYGWLLVFGLSCDRPAVTLPMDSAETDGTDSGMTETASPDSGEDTGTVVAGFRAVVVPTYAE